MIRKKHLHALTHKGSADSLCVLCSLYFAPRSLVATLLGFFVYFRPFDNASRAMLKNDSSEICWSIIWNHQNPAKNLKTYKPTDLKTYKPTSIKI